MVKIKIKDIEEVKNVFISVADKEGLRELILCLFSVNPNIIIYTTESNYEYIYNILPVGDSAIKNLRKVKNLKNIGGGNFRVNLIEPVVEDLEIRFEVLVLNLFLVADPTILAKGSYCAMSTCNKDIDILTQLLNFVDDPHSLVLCGIDQYTHFCEQLHKSGGQCKGTCIEESVRLSKNLANLYSEEIENFLKNIGEWLKNRKKS